MYIYILVSYNPSSYMFSSDNAISRHSNNTLPPSSCHSLPGSASQVIVTRWTKLKKKWYEWTEYRTWFSCSLSSNFSIWVILYMFFGLILFVTNRVETFSIIWVLHNIQFQYNIYIFIDTHICGRAMNVQRSEMFLCTQDIQISTTY